MKKIIESKNFISEIIDNRSVETLIVLGSGMSGFEEKYEHEYQINYSEVPNFITPSVKDTVESFLLLALKIN